jgi:hypothetical protein
MYIVPETPALDRFDGNHYSSGFFSSKALYYAESGKQLFENETG